MCSSSVCFVSVCSLMTTKSDFCQLLEVCYESVIVHTCNSLCVLQFTSPHVHLLFQGFLDIDLTDLRKGGANITGFQLVNNSEPSVSHVVQQWMEFDNKDSKMPKNRLKVLLLCSPACPPLLRLSSLLWL